MKTTPDWQFVAETLPEQWVKTRRFARAGLLLAIINVLVIVTAPLTRLYLDVSGLHAFRAFFYAVQFGVVLALTGLLFIVIALLKNIVSVRNAGLIIFLLGSVPVGAILHILGPDKLGRPMIHDITTDTIDPPAFTEARKLRSSRENSMDYAGPEIANLQLQAYPDIKSLISTMNRDSAMDEAIQVVKDLRWEFVNIDFEQGIVEAYDTTRVFGFVDDIVIRIRRDGNGSRIDIRSASRLGKGDLGKNADRIRSYTRIFRNP